MRTLLILTASLMLAAPVSAATPQPGVAWKKITAAYATTAKAHGLTATCEPYNRVMSARCYITREDEKVGFVLSGYAKGYCEFRLTFLSETFGGNRRATVALCEPRWWVALPVPGPWTPASP